MRWSCFDICGGLAQTHQAREDSKYILKPPYFATEKNLAEYDSAGGQEGDPELTISWATADHEPKDKNDNCAPGESSHSIGVLME